MMTLENIWFECHSCIGMWELIQIHIFIHQKVLPLSFLCKISLDNITVIEDRYSQRNYYRRKYSWNFEIRVILCYKCTVRLCWNEKNLNVNHYYKKCQIIYINCSPKSYIKEWIKVVFYPANDRVFRSFARIYIR